MTAPDDELPGDLSGPANEEDTGEPTGSTNGSAFDPRSWSAGALLGAATAITAATLLIGFLVGSTQSDPAPESATTTTLVEELSAEVGFETISRDVAVLLTAEDEHCEFGVISYELTDPRSEEVVRKGSVEAIGRVSTTRSFMCSYVLTVDRVPSIPRYTVSFTGGAGSWELEDTISREEFSSGFTITIEGDEPAEPDPPTTTTTTAPPQLDTADLVRLAGEPCDRPGERQEPPPDSDYEVDPNGEVSNGLYCSKDSVWAFRSTPGEPCSVGFGGKSWVGPRGQSLSCIENVLFLPGQPRTSFFGGNYVVGTDTAQVAPGVYETFDVSDCYWETVDGSGNILDNNFITGAPRAELTIGSGAAGVNSNGCGEWKKIG